MKGRLNWLREQKHENGLLAVDAVEKKGGDNRSSLVAIIWGACEWQIPRTGLSLAKRRISIEQRKVRPQLITSSVIQIFQTL